ncbi:flavodoxin domain-containing protein [Streptomyces sp. NRRL B-24484]|uniref:flavodoxin domain-containing protein n=1 Tax=Streptomyces sp. NRRL B-24484 TaxID=1463833 RepID=UPI0004BF113B|nr:flavodoxin domain-containing protein [Streptomyces sp. NRRL B-24484]
MLVFVGCASAYGSTRRIAERIARQLRSDGHDTVLRPLDRAAGLPGCDAAVLGSAVHGGRWLPDAVEFVRRNAGALAARPVGLFSVSLVGERSSAFPSPVARGLRRLKARSASELPADLLAAIAPVGRHDFAGAVAPEHWPATGRLVFRLMGGRYGEHTDWDEVDAWAAVIAARVSGRPPE